MKQFLFFIAFLTSQLSYSQCYIQYGYDASGNRTSRTYIGGFAKTSKGFTVYMLSASIGFTGAPVNLSTTFFRNETFIDDRK
jgi:hypothetical protein